MPVSAVALIGCFLVPAGFYLWMGLPGGGVIIALDCYIRKLAEAGYMAVNKTCVHRKPRPGASATTAGRKVFKEHVAAFELILKSK